MRNEDLSKFMPRSEWDALDLENVQKSRDFMHSRAETKRFKPMEIADCHIARCCGNCIFNKGRIDDLHEFMEYGRAFYYGFCACTLNGRTPDKCRVTEVNNVCSSHKFDGKGINPRKPSKALMHIAVCIEAKKRDFVPHGTDNVPHGTEEKKEANKKGTETT